MNDLHIFTNDEFGQVRTLYIDGEIWFVGKDVAKALGYSNASKAVISHVDDEDKRIEMLPTSQNGNMVGKIYIINESGLYSLIFASKLPSAKKFKRWVTAEILPALRKCGTYIVDGTTVEYITPRERLSLAKLIVNAPKDRLSAVKKIVQPLIGVDLDELLPTLYHNMIISTDEVIKRTWQLMEQYGVEKDDEIFVDVDTFTEAFTDVGTRTARKILEFKGMLVRDNNTSDGARTRTCLRYINGHRKRCIVIKND